MDSESVKQIVDEILETGSGDGEQMQKRKKRTCHCPRQTAVVSCLILLLGGIACAILLGVGLKSVKEEQEEEFEELAEEVLQETNMVLERYVETALWMHQAASMHPERMTHAEFRQVYEYANSTDVSFRAMGLLRRVETEEMRLELENHTRTFLQENYPEEVDSYRGIWGVQPDHELDHLADGQDRFLDHLSHVAYPAHFVEPVEQANLRSFIDFDVYSMPWASSAIDQVINSWRPVVTSLVEHDDCTAYDSENGTCYTVSLLHPGLHRKGDSVKDIGILQFMFSDLFSRIQIGHMGITCTLYLFDTTNPDSTIYLGGATLEKPSNFSSYEEEDDIRTEIILKPEVDMETLSGMTQFCDTSSISFASSEWTLIVKANDTEFPRDTAFIYVGVIMIFVACSCLALLVHLHYRRMEKVNKIRSLAAAEKAELLVLNARRAAKQERELNDFLSHEVRNPLSAAISACSFVKASVHEAQPLVDEESKKSTREDVVTIETSLQFINDLLRNMLDMHRASSKQLTVEVVPVDLLRDVLEPVANMLYQRGHNYEVEVSCPEDLIVETDRLRLKQTILNLARNSSKFVQRGFIRLRARVGDRGGRIYLYVEDSGPGIPKEKRDNLFEKYQKSLDSLNQGTGLGLCLCKNLVELLGGHLWLDEDYDSGVEGAPGARFVICLNSRRVSQNSMSKLEQSMTQLEQSVSKLPFSSEEILVDSTARTDSETNGSGQTEPSEDLSHVKIQQQQQELVEELPDSLSVLFVDDDLMLRKLFSRSLKRAMPGWQVREAANGETALTLVESEDFDVIFVDQYMSSADKQLLGTETVHALRAKGVKRTLICGLSANDLETNFLRAGADAFMIKPFPCKPDDLKRALVQILHSRSAVAVVEDKA